MSTYIVKIQDNSYCDDTIVCSCLKNCEPHEPIKIIRRKRSTPFVNTRPSSRDDDSTDDDGCSRSSNKQKRINCENIIRQKAIEQHENRCKQNPNNKNNEFNFELKFYDLIMSAGLTILFWHLVLRPREQILYQIITSALILFLVTCFKYNKHIHDKNFWRCLTTNYAPLMQAYCAVLTLCILICLCNNFILTFFFSTYGYFIVILIIGILYVRLRLNEIHVQCEN
jgi:hypothetical protein